MEVSITVDIFKFKKYMEAWYKASDVILDSGSRALYDFLVEYHSRIDWKESHWFPGMRSGDFARQVVEGWQPPTRSGNVIEIRNTFGLLNWKIKGGVITPRRASHLTIPLISEARGFPVAVFSAGTGQRLFRVGRALCRKIGGKVEAVYALSLGVKQYPYPNAMPTGGAMRTVVRSAAKETAKMIE
jgi:hypothetical protein